MTASVRPPLFLRRRPDRGKNGGRTRFVALRLSDEEYRLIAEYSRTAIEDVYHRLVGDARNQYTLGYMTRATPSDTRREIEIRVSRPGCKSSDLRPCVEVFSKEGYYPLPAR